MRFAPLLVLIAILFSLAPAPSACADCGPGSPPDCTCIVNVSEEIGFGLQGGLIEYHPVTPVSQSAGTLTVTGNNLFSGQTSILNVTLGGAPTLVPENYYPVPDFSAGTIHTITTLSPTINLPVYSPIVNPRIQNYWSGSSSGMVSFSTYNFGGITLRSDVIYPLSVYSATSELAIPEPTSLALVAFGFVASAAIRRARSHR